MSRRIIKTVIQLLLLSSAFFSCRNLEDDASYSSETKKIKEELRAEALIQRPTPLYAYQENQIKCLEDDFPLFFTQEGDLPYVEVAYFITSLYSDEYIITRKDTKYIVTLTRKQDNYLTIDFSDGQVTYSDYDYFLIPSNASASIDVIADDSLLEREPIVNINGENVSYSINLKDYNIPVIYEYDYGFLPMNTLMLLLDWGGLVTYNGKEAFIELNSEWQIPEYSAKMSNPKKNYSQEMADFSYNHLCLALDVYYGRKDYLGVSNFDSWLTAAGLKDDLTSTNINTAETALAKLLLQNIGDIHTYYIHWTPFKGVNPKEEPGRGLPAGCLYPMPPNIQKGPTETRRDNYADILYEKLITQRSSAFYYKSDTDYAFINIFIPKDQSTDATNPIPASKNTIFMFFRNFISRQNYADNYKPNWRFNKNFDDIVSKGEADGILFYISENGSENLVQAPESEIKTMSDFISKVKTGAHGYGISLKNTNDDIQLMLISNYIIRKLNEDNTRPIENVVLDLSLNGGGANDDETIFASWLLGESLVCYKNTATGSKCAVRYTADINFDGKIDNLDTIKDLKRHCITSLKCFSCGNLLPAQIYFNDSVKTFGEKTGGGTCPLAVIAMPSGTQFYTSSQIQLGTLINGSFVDIDSGVDVDTPIFMGEFDKVYNRNTFCKEYLN